MTLMQQQEGDAAVTRSIRDILLQTGAAAVGFARAETLPTQESLFHAQWIGEGKHAGMDWLCRHLNLKRDPSNVLPGVSTIISLAYSYTPERWRDPSLPMVACYAYGSDYHDVLRKRLRGACRTLGDTYGGRWRICVDSAPVAERFWALRAGIGVRGLNGSVIVPGAGSLCFLAEILTTLPLCPDTPSTDMCSQCGACSRACPTGALLPDGTVDSRRCLSYLTIEHRGPFDTLPEGIPPQGVLFGCDICQRVCPHNLHGQPTPLQELAPGRAIDILPSEIDGMDEEEFATLFGHSPLKRAGLDNLRRNLTLK